MSHLLTRWLTFISFLLVSSFIGENAGTAVKEQLNGPPITTSMILPFHKTVEEDDKKPSSKQIGDLPARRKENYFLSFC